MKLEKQKFNLMLSIVVFFVIGSKLVFGLENIPQIEREKLAPEHKVVINPELEKALLAEDWNTVADRCEKYDMNDLASSPVLRAIKGHACIALNRNNESFVMFLSVVNDKDRQEWKKWSEELASQKDCAIAHYFRGDSLARLGDSDLAIQSYNKALQLEPNMALAMVARGVNYAARLKWDEARKDFDKACEMRPAFAESYASLGTLQILRKAPKGACDSYEKALKISPDYVLALNGLGCAKYGLGDWSGANEDFNRAAAILPLPLFLGNLRALGVAAENLDLPGLENSPLFRFTDFLDWTTLRAESEKEEDVIHILYGSQLSEDLDAGVIAKLNKALENPGFYVKIKDKIDLENISEGLLKLIEETESIRNTELLNLTEKEKDEVILLNRLLIEHAYPYLIAKHNQRDPGMQLTLTRGLMDQMAYKNSLTSGQIAAGQWRMDHLWRPFANAFESSGLPVATFVGKELNQHLAFSTHTNEIALGKNYGISLDTVRPGGVTSDMRRAFVDKGEWPVTNWFGLAQSAAYMASGINNDEVGIRQ